MNPKPDRPTRRVSSFALAIGLLLPGMALWRLAPSMPLIITLPGWAGLTLAGLALMAWDKRAATRDRPRLPEALLLVVGLVGGWPGVGLGRIVFRHKTRKLGFTIGFWLIAALHQITAGLVLLDALKGLR